MTRRLILTFAVLAAVAIATGPALLAHPGHDQDPQVAFFPGNVDGKPGFIDKMSARIDSSEGQTKMDAQWYRIQAKKSGTRADFEHQAAKLVRGVR